MSSADPTDCPTERLPLLKTESSSALPHPYSPSRHLQNLCIVPGSPPTSPGTGCCGIRLPVPLRGWTSKVRRVFRRARGKQGQGSEDVPLLQASGPSSDGSYSGNADFFAKLNRKPPESPIQRTSSPFIPTATAATSEASVSPSSSPRGDHPDASNADALPQTTEALLSLLTPKLFLLFHFFIAISTAASAHRPAPAATPAPPHGYPFSHSTPIQPRGPLSSDPFAFYTYTPPTIMSNTPEATGAHAISPYPHATAGGWVPSPRKRSSQHIHSTFGDGSSQYPHIRYVPDDYNSRRADGSSPAEDRQRYAEQFTRQQTDIQYPPASGSYYHNYPNAAGTVNVVGQQPGGGMRQRSRLGDNVSFYSPGPGNWRPVEDNDDLDDLLTQLQDCNRPTKKRVCGYAPPPVPYPRSFVADEAAPSRWDAATRNAAAAHQDFTAARTARPLSDFSHSVINKIIQLQLYGLTVTWSGLTAILQLGTIDLSTVQELTSAGCLARDWHTTGMLDVVFKITEDEQLVKSLVATPVSAAPFPGTAAHNDLDSSDPFLPLRPEISPSAQKLLCDLLELDFDGLELNVTFAKTLLGRDISLEDFQQLAAMRYLKLMTPMAPPEECVFLVTLRAAVWDEDRQMSNPPWQQPPSGGQSRALSGLTPDYSMSEAPDSPLTSWLRSDSPPTAASGMHLDGCKAPADIMQSPFLEHSLITKDTFNKPSGNGQAPADVKQSLLFPHSLLMASDDMHSGNGKTPADVMRSPFVSYSPPTFDGMFRGNLKAPATVMQSRFLPDSQQQAPSPLPGNHAAATGIVQNQMKSCPPTISHSSPFLAVKSPFRGDLSPIPAGQSPFPAGQSRIPAGQSPFAARYSPFLSGPSSPTGQQGVQPPSCCKDPRSHSDANSLPVAAMDGLFLNDDTSSTAGSLMSAGSSAGGVGVPDMESKLQVVRGKIADLGLQDVQITVQGLSDVLGMKLEEELLTLLAQEGLLRLVVNGDYMEVRIY